MLIDKEYSFEKKIEKAQRRFWIIFSIVGIITLVTIGLIIYVIAHFLGKVW